MWHPSFTSKKWLTVLCTAALAVAVSVAGVKAATSGSNGSGDSPDTTIQTATHTVLPTQTYSQTPAPVQTYTTPAAAPTSIWTYSPTPTPTAIVEACAGLLSVMNDLDKIMDEAEVNMFILEQQGTSHAMIDHAIQQNIWNQAHASFVKAHTAYKRYDCRPIVVDTRG